METQKSKNPISDIMAFLSKETPLSRTLLFIALMSIFSIEMFILATMMSGCDARNPKSIEYYKDHLDEAKSVVAECNANKTNDENCANANTAVFRFSGKKPIRGNEPHIRTW